MGQVEVRRTDRTLAGGPFARITQHVAGQTRAVVQQGLATAKSVFIAKPGRRGHERIGHVVEVTDEGRLVENLPEGLGSFLGEQLGVERIVGICAKAAP